MSKISSTRLPINSVALVRHTGPLVEPLIWLQSFNLAEKPLITYILINKPLNFARSI